MKQSTIKFLLPLLCFLGVLPATLDAQEICPKEAQDSRPEPGRKGGGGLVENDDATTEYCSVVLNENIVVSWPRTTSNLSESQIAELVARTKRVALRAFEVYTEIYNTTGAELLRRNNGRKIVFALFAKTISGITPLGGFHYEHDIYVSLDLEQRYRDNDESFGKLFEYTAAHEMFHAFQRQMKSVDDYESPDGWVIEGTANWGAEQVVDDFPLERRNATCYSWPLRGFYETITEKGLTGLDYRNQRGEVTEAASGYPAHMYWRYYTEVKGRDAMKQVLINFASSHENKPILEQLDLASHWHNFSKASYNLSPWNGLGADYPSPVLKWRPRVKEKIVVSGESFSQVVPVTLPPVSLALVRIKLRSQSPYAQLMLYSSSSRRGRLEERGLQASALIIPAEPDSDDDLRDADAGKYFRSVNGAREKELQIGHMQKLCFNSQEEVCEGVAEIYSGAKTVDVLVSNHNIETPQTIKIFVSTSPSAYRLKGVRVGERFTPVRQRGSLTLTKLGPDTFRMEAEDFWFEYSDEHYSRLMGPPSGDERAEVSNQIVTKYVRERLGFQGFVEVSHQADDSREIEEVDELTWVPLKTSKVAMGGFYNTPHFFRVDFDRRFFHALGGNMGLGGMAFQNMIYALNKTRFPENSFAWRNQLWFYNAITLGLEDGSVGKPKMAVDSTSGDLLFKLSDMTLVFAAEGDA